MGQQEIIGLTGGMCSGKDSWADFFQEEFGFEHHSTSNIARDYIREHGLGEPTRDLTRETATHLRNVHGSDYLIRKAIENAGDSERIVVSGIYVVPEALYLRRIGGSIINIVADDNLRFERMSKRRRSGEAPNIDEYRRLMDNDFQSELTDQRLADVLGLAQYDIDGSIPIRDKEACRKLAIHVLGQIAKEER